MAGRRKSGDKSPAVQTLRVDRVFSKLAKRLDCVCFSTALRLAVRAADLRAVVVSISESACNWPMEKFIFGKRNPFNR